VLRALDAYEVVVVGAGILGCAVGYHLQELGVRRVAVVERAQVGSGATQAGAGFLEVTAGGFHWYWGRQEHALELYGLAFYADLEARGYNFGLRLDGNLFLAVTEDGWEGVVLPFATQPLAPPGAVVLTPTQVGDVARVVRPGSVRGGVYFPNGGQLETGPMVVALAHLIQSRGGVVLEGMRVRGVTTHRGAVTGVETSEGRILAPQVVVAAGGATNQVLDSARCRLPLLRAVDSRVISQVATPPTKLPTVMIPDLKNAWLREGNDAYTYGSALGYRLLHAVDASKIDAERLRRPLTRARAAQVTADMATVFPALASVGLDRVTEGVVARTPDRRFIVGPEPSVSGLYVAAGCNEAGIAHGPGLGRFLADVIVNGSSTFIDGVDYQPARFARDAFPTARAIEKAMPPRWRPSAPSSSTVASVAAN
jgi:sarcosine oxidase subunit beta